MVSLSVAQQQRNCASMEHLQLQMEQDPQLEERMQQIEQFTSDILANGAAERSVDGIITIPVVVHVIWNINQPQQNISDAQIQSQIDVLNEDLRRLNADASETLPEFQDVAADLEIEFCLASVDPAGNPTTGIERKSSTRSSWGTGSAMKRSGQGGFDAWPRDSYLNMWSCNIGGGILGFATFPGGNAADDGVVVSPQYFGSRDYDTNNDFYLSSPFDLGRTMTHEVGHWANLRHIWGDGPCSIDDFVDDTPRSDNSNYGCPLNHFSCSNKDMVQNYMDYTDDGCMNIFTEGQKARARALFEPGGARAAMLNSAGCGDPEPVCRNPSGVAFEFDGNNVVISLTGSYFGEAYVVTVSGGDLAQPVTYTLSDPQVEDFSPISEVLPELNPCVEYVAEIVTQCFGLGSEIALDPLTVFVFGPECEPPSCDAPENLYATNITWQQATLGWDAEDEAESYRVQGRLRGGLGIFVRTRIIEGTSFRTNNLFPFLTYEFHVQALCGGDLGNSPYSPWFPFTLNPITNPGFGPVNGDTGLEEEVRLFDIDHVINTYPNPSHGPVNISYMGEDLGDARIIVTDIMGKEVRQYDVDLLLNGTRQIDLSGLHNGLYLLTFKKDGIHLYTEKVMLSR
jgi:hypothetical protein